MCEICGMRFGLLENLNRHRMIHTDQRPFPCTYCTKRFRLAQHLKEHIRIHTGKIRTFVCFRGVALFQKQTVTFILDLHFACRCYRMPQILDAQHLKLPYLRFISVKLRRDDGYFLVWLEKSPYGSMQDYRVALK